ncbi:StAR-related lipid transfer protein like [Quillaja saponaria]|uniref:StAR-related lipid transfer protein like n=1 Tax=Quillaja saponaria TaxID=32244 RepID=A0AAD7PKY6_QUISA|nr:StAR-related lipid transfer protein like [Quillaja saponaria]
MALIEALYEILENPTLLGVFTGVIMFLGPIWIAFVIGVSVGWAWKPKWANLGKDKLACSVSNSLDLWSLRADVSPLKGFGSAPCLNSLKFQSPSCESWVMNNGVERKSSSVKPAEYIDCSASNLSEEISNAVTEEDLEHICQLVEEKDGGPSWIHMMDRSTPNMSYQAWRRDPKTGPPQYRSSTIFEDATPEIVRDFFWDDEFRPKWDDMLASSTTLEECPTTGTMVVQWVRKFPFFCKDREYIIGRRIWESGRSYYCVTKGITYPSIPRRDKPRRVDLYYSSWCIRAVESKRYNGQLTACEVLLFHHEDMGIPWEIAKLGVRKGMWGAVQKIEPGLRTYQQARASGAPLSRPAFMAQINTKVNPRYLQSLGGTDNQSENEIATTSERPPGMQIPKILIIGGAVALACTLDQGLLTKAVIFGVARRFANLGKRL